jgi:hypothetical protein
VLAVREVAKGRVLTLLTDTSWLWRFAAGSGPSTYDAFWRRAMRYLLGDPEFARLRVVTAHKAYPARTDFRVAVVATDVRYRPLKGVDVSWKLLRTDRNPAAELKKGRGTTGADGELGVKLRLPAGSYRLEATGLLDGRPVRAQGVLVTEGTAAELADVRTAPDLLAAVAKATGGRVLKPDGLHRARFHKPRVVRLDNLRSESLLGNAWLLWALLAAFLAAEWLLRRRFALA